MLLNGHLFTELANPAVCASRQTEQRRAEEFRRPLKAQQGSIRQKPQAFVQLEVTKAREAGQGSKSFELAETESQTETRGREGTNEGGQLQRRRFPVRAQEAGDRERSAETVEGEVSGRRGRRCSSRIGCSSGIGYPPERQCDR